MTTDRLQYEDGQLWYGDEFLFIEREDIELLIDELRNYKMFDGVSMFGMPEDILVTVNRFRVLLSRSGTDELLHIPWEEIEPPELLVQLRSCITSPQLSIVD